MRRADECELDEVSGPPEASLESCDEAAEATPRQRGECPAQLLDEFVHRMADHGRSIQGDLMQADPEYAMWQLARARTTDDAPLRQVAAQLFACLDPGTRAA